MKSRAVALFFVNGETARLRPPSVETPGLSPMPGTALMPNLSTTALEPSVAVSEE